MLRLSAFGFLGSVLFLTASAFAQDESDSPAPADAAAATIDAVVLGLSANDLLNIREEASPLGRTMGRLPNGSLIRLGECEAVNGYDWCRIEAVEEGFSGWAPARYLQSLNEASPLETTSAPPASMVVDPLADSIMAAQPTAPATGIPLPTPAPREVEETVAEAEIDAEAATEVEAEPESEADTGPRPETDGKGARLHAEEPANQLPSGLAARFAAGSSVPLENVLSADGDHIPCARYVGQPMTRCIVRVERQGDDSADITVVWPDGGTRLIEFRDGVPSRSNSRGELRHTKEGSLNLIRIGISERFEILDALALED